MDVIEGKKVLEAMEVLFGPTDQRVLDTRKQMDEEAAKQKLARPLADQAKDLEQQLKEVTDRSLRCEKRVENAMETVDQAKLALREAEQEVAESRVDGERIRAELGTVREKLRVERELAARRTAMEAQMARDDGKVEPFAPVPFPEWHAIRYAGLSEKAASWPEHLKKSMEDQLKVEYDLDMAARKKTA